MIPTPRTDALKIPSEAMLLLGQKGVPAQIVNAILTLGDHARQLEQELYWARERIAELHESYRARWNEVSADVAREMEQERDACLEDIRKADEMLLAWFKAASPWATPGSLEEGLKNLRNEVIEECADLADQKLDHISGTEHVYRGDVADNIRALKNTASSGTPRDGVTGRRDGLSTTQKCGSRMCVPPCRCDPPIPVKHKPVS